MMTDQPPPYYPEKTGPYPPAAPQPQAAYPPPQEVKSVTVIVYQPVVTAQPLVFRDQPVVVTDSNGQQVTTQLEYRSGVLTWLICCFICWFTGLWCLAPIAFCIDATKDVYHITPTDGKIVGIYKRI